jgi:AcrR family transcriptional regulator
MEDVAARAGVTKGAIYFYFKTKERLFEAMVTHYSQGILADADATLAATRGSHTERLKAFLEYIYGRCAHDRHGREIIRFMVAEGQSFPNLVERYRSDFFIPAMRIISELLAAGTKSGEFDSEIAQQGAEIVVAPAALLTLMRLIFDQREPIDEKAYITVHVKLLLRGLLTPAARDNARW